MQSKKQTAVTGLFYSVSVGVFVVALCNQGSFYCGGVILAGLLAAIFSVCGRTSVRASDIPFVLFCAWYFFCAVKDGFTVEYAAMGLIPLIVYLFFLMCRADSENKDKFLYIFLRICIPISVISVILWVIMSIEKGFIARAYFPFFYSNTTGIFFGVCYILASLSDDAVMKKAKYFFLFSLLTTMSVGAAAITYLAILATDKNKKRVALYTAVCIVGAFFMKERLIESGGTFAERLLQIHDGIMCAAANPIFGIGAGRWENAKQLYQTGFYTAKLIHCSPIQVCAESGFIGGILLLISALAAMLRIKGDRKSFVCAVMLFAHSFFDFDLYFAAFGMFFALLVCPAENTSIPQRRSASVAARTLCLSLTVVFTANAVILASAKRYESAAKTYGADFAIAEYETTAAMFSSNATEVYANALAESGRRDEYMKVYDKIEYPSSKLTIQRIILDGNDVGEIEAFLNEQPFNTEFSEAFGDGVVSEKALVKMSHFGKKLYEMRGTNE